MIQITFNIDAVQTRPNPSEVLDDLSQIFAGNVRIVDIIVLPDGADPSTPERNLPA